MTLKYPNIKPLASKADVTFLGMAWTAWVRGSSGIDWDTDTTMIIDAFPDSVLTTDGYRRPCGSSGTDDAWYLNNTGNVTAERARFQDEANMLAEASLDRGELWYPPASLIGVGAARPESKIYDAGIGNYLASTTPHKFWLVWQDAWAAYDGNSPGTWGNFTAFLNSIVTLCGHAQYRRITYGGIANRPVIGLYKLGSANWDAARVATIDAALAAAGLGAGFYIQCNGDVATANALGCHGITYYGPQGSMPAAGGQVAYTAQITQDLTLDTIAGSNQTRVFPITHCNDNRPRPSGYVSWTDTPTYTQFEQYLRDRWAAARADFQRNPSHLLSMYNYKDLDEGGPFFPPAPSILRGVNSPSRGMYLAALKHVRTGSFPSTYNDYYHSQTKHADFNATPAGWAVVESLYGASGGTSGAYMGREMQNSTTTNKRTMTVTGVRMRVYGGMRVGLGTIRFILDGGANNDVNQGVLVGTGYNQLLYDSGTISNASHTLSVERVSGTVAHDEWVVGKSR